MLSTEEFEAWLEAYKSAWESGDAKALKKIFSEDAVYQSTPYALPMKGLDQIQEYWARLAEDQSGIVFEFKVWNVEQDVGVAHWRCRYTKKSTSEAVDVDGIFRCVVSAGKCDQLLAWWHMRKTNLGEI